LKLNTFAGKCLANLGQGLISHLWACRISKEKRSDCPLVVFSGVINSQGFIRHSGIYEGNIPDMAIIEGDSFIIVLSFPFDIYGRNVNKVTGFSLALTLTFG